MNSAKTVETLIAEWKHAGIDKTQLVVNDAEAKVGWPYCWGAIGQYCTVANRKAKMNNSRISDGDRELIRKRCQVLNGSKSACTGCTYYPNSQTTRMYDCIGFINSLLDDAGIDHYGAGCSIMWSHKANWLQTGKIANIPEMVCLVFQQEPGNEKKMQHIGLYIGNNWVIHCSGTVKKQTLSSYPWTHFGVLKGLGGEIPVPTTKPTLRRGSTGPYVVECQTDLITLRYDVGPSGADGKYGAKTEAAVKQFQKDHALTADGICGPRTWDALDAAVGPQPAPVLYTVIIPHLTVQQANELLKQYPDGEKRSEGSGL